MVLGINPAVNTPALFDYARRKDVVWFEDRQCVSENLSLVTAAVESFLAPLDSLYLTICLDAFPAAVAPGVSAPGVPGICPYTTLNLLDAIKQSCAANNTRLVLLDIAEMSPAFDRDHRTLGRTVGAALSATAAMKPDSDNRNGRSRSRS